MTAQVILILSDIISVITVALCLILKVPQIFRLLRAGSSVGLSLTALLLQISSLSITMMYNYTNGHALLSYLEYPLLLAQEFIITALVLIYSGLGILPFCKIILAFVSICGAFAYGLLPSVILLYLIPLTIPIGALSKSMQFLEIVRRGNADSVSALTWFLSVFTNVTRIFTVYVDSADVALLCNFSISSFFSLSVLLATLYYQRGSRAKSE